MLKISKYTVLICCLAVFFGCNKDKQTAVKSSNNLSQEEKWGEEGKIASEFIKYGNQKSASFSGVDWSYNSPTGPTEWASLTYDFILCAEGVKQSPIDISTDDVDEVGGENLVFHYQASGLTVVNNGHTIVVSPTIANYLIKDGVRYDLLQLHFHAQSEHAIDGRLSPMEVHLVHISSTNELLVVGVMLEIGDQNNVLASFFSDLPANDGDYINSTSLVNIIDLIPEDKTVFNYSGSLTTPPCSEGVNWNVMVESTTLSMSQLTAFTTLYNHNRRPTLDLNGRTIVEEENE